jgi:hypothetical protein
MGKMAQDQPIAPFDWFAKENSYMDVCVKR